MKDPPVDVSESTISTECLVPTLVGQTFLFVHLADQGLGPGSSSGFLISLEWEWIPASIHPGCEAGNLLFPHGAPRDSSLAGPRALLANA